MSEAGFKSGRRCKIACTSGLLVSLTAAAPNPDYRIALDLDPAAGRIAADVTMRHLACTGPTLRLYLNRDLAVTAVAVDGNPVEPRLDPPDAGKFWLEQDRAIDLPCPQRSLRIRYAGPGQLHPDGRNQVSSNLIELSLYGGWYPLANIGQRTKWQVTTRLPAGWTFATPGRVHYAAGALTITARTPSDIVLLAAPSWRVLPRTGATRVLLAADATPAETGKATQLGQEASAATAAFAALLGPPPGGMPHPELIFTLRPGPASYARLPLIVTPQAFLGDDRGRPNALNVRHEVGHFWSRARGDSDDWINEGLAEYLAVRRTGDVEGAAARDAILTEYRTEVAAAGPGTPIVGPGVQREYINRYQRPALLFDALERRLGRPAVDRLLRRISAASQPTTAEFVRLAGAAGAGDIVSRCLAARDWPADCGGTP